MIATLPALLALVTSPIHASNDEGYAYESTYRTLCAQLQQQTQILSAVVDLSTAQAAVAAYVECSQRLQELHQYLPSENEFVQYVDNDPSRKRQLNLLLFALSREMDRLYQAKCYGGDALATLLFPAMVEAPAEGS